LPEVKVDLVLLGMKNKDMGFIFDSYNVQQYIDNYDDTLMSFEKLQQKFSTETES